MVKDDLDLDSDKASTAQQLNQRNARRNAQDAS